MNRKSQRSRSVSLLTDVDPITLEHLDDAVLHQICQQMATIHDYQGLASLSHQNLRLHRICHEYLATKQEQHRPTYYVIEATPIASRIFMISMVLTMILIML